MSAGYAIVLSTFNGGAYVEAQVESIRRQTATGWRLYVRDDRSSDDTHRRLAALAARDARIEILAGPERNVGPAASFGRLLEHALERGERHVFLSDQDDVWLPDKCERMLARLAALEAQRGAGLPLLVHSDLRVVGDDLAVRHASFVALQDIDLGARYRPARMLLANSVTGCAALANAALLRCALPMPRVAMHDWWLGQCAAAFGEVHFLDQPTVLYRQHGANAVGASGYSGRAAVMARAPGAWWDDSGRRFLAGLRQVWVLRARAQSQGLVLAEGMRHAIDALWRGLGESSGSLRSRLAAVRASGALPHPRLRRGLLLARVALLPRLRRRLGDERDVLGEPRTVAAIVPARAREGD